MKDVKKFYFLLSLLVALGIGALGVVFFWKIDPDPQSGASGSAASNPKKASPRTVPRNGSRASDGNAGAGGGRSLHFDRPSGADAGSGLPRYPYTLPVTNAETLKALQKKTSIRYLDRPIEEALRDLSAQVGVRFELEAGAIPGGAQGIKVTLSVEQLSAENILRLILGMNGLASAILDDGRVLISTKEAIAEASTSPAQKITDRIEQLRLQEGAPAVETPGVLEDQKLYDLLATRRVSLQLSDTTLPDAVGRLRDLSGLNIVLTANLTPESLQARTDANLADATLDSALCEIARGRGLGYSISGGVVMLSPEEEAAAARDAAQKAIQEARRRQEELQTLLARPVSAEYDGTPLPLVVQDVSKQLGCDVVTDRETWEAAAPVSVRHEGTVQSFLDDIARATGTFWLHRDGRFYLLKAAQPPK